MLLSVHQIDTYYDIFQAIFQVSLKVEKEEVVCLLGRNGAGKTTTLASIVGLNRPRLGSIQFKGQEITGLKSYQVVKLGIGFVPEHRWIFSDLTVRENLELGWREKKHRRMFEDIYQLFPKLRDLENQKGGHLSGGEQQMLTIARTLMGEPELLLLDEPTAGVDPKARREFWDEIHQLAADGLTVLITTHYMDEAERCHRLAYIAYGNLLASGAVDEVVKTAALTTWEVTGNDLPALAEKIRGLPGVEQVVAFGTALHVSGRDVEKLRESVQPFMNGEFRWKQISSGLEDVFISLMDTAEDNFS